LHGTNLLITGLKVQGSGFKGCDTGTEGGKVRKSEVYPLFRRNPKSFGSAAPEATRGRFFSDLPTFLGSNFLNFLKKTGVFNLEP
jgi:hypothetical protein